MTKHLHDEILAKELATSYKASLPLRLTSIEGRSLPQHLPSLKHDTDKALTQ